MGDPLELSALRRLSLADAVPDPDTLWGFREKLRRTGVIDRLFPRFKEALRRRGLLLRDGHIVDTPFVEVPRQRNSREEKAELKEGRNSGD